MKKLYDRESADIPQLVCQINFSPLDIFKNFYKMKILCEKSFENNTKKTLLLNNNKNEFEKNEKKLEKSLISKKFIQCFIMKYAVCTDCSIFLSPPNCPKCRTSTFPTKTKLCNHLVPTASLK